MACGKAIISPVIDMAATSACNCIKGRREREGELAIFSQV